MITSRWWWVALAAVSAFPIALMLVDGASDAALAITCGIVAAYVVVFVCLRPAVDEGNRPGLWLALATVLFAGSLTALLPTLATVQFFGYPLLWVVAGSRRSAIWWSAALAAAVGLGFAISLGVSADTLPMIAATPVLSFGFSIVMGLWISHIAELGEEQARLLTELRATQGELAALHRDAGVTAERSRMSREVHDTVAQSLAGLVMLAQRAQREFVARTLSADTLALIESSAQDALTETRALVAASAPVELAQGGLAQALTLLAERFERETRIRVSTDALVSAPLERDLEVVLLRSAQEGLANVRKHAHARSATVTLVVDDVAARLTVTDDGHGFASTVPHGFGLRGLRDRLALAGGTLDVTSAPGATTLTARVPQRGAA